MSTERRASCPYAVALEDDEQSAHSNVAADVLNQAKTSCPAFSAGDCPFSSAKSPDQVRHALNQVPKSHYKEAYFKQALQHIHVVNPNVEQEGEFALKECPVSDYMKEEITFGDAMEGFSLAAIMSRLAQDLEGEETDEELSEELKAPTVPSPTKPPVATVSLSQAFKSGTAVAHQAAEDVHFVKNFIRGKIDRDLYADMVLGLFYVYDTMEVLLDQHAPTNFQECHFPRELARTATLAEDLDFWHGSPMPTQPPSPATKDYMERLESIAREKPLLLLSHAYTRYLGDLSGGKVLQRVARRAMNLGDDGLAFYNFDKVPSAKRFKDEYRLALDHLPLSAQDVDDLVKEANVAFLLNMRLFEELDVKANVPGASVRTLKDTFAILDQPANTAASEECPFLQKKKAAAPAAKADGGRCPWPFVFFHDPIMGLQDWQTWIVVGLLLCWIWSFLQ